MVRFSWVEFIEHPIWYILAYTNWYLLMFFSWCLPSHRIQLYKISTYHCKTWLRVLMCSSQSLSFMLYVFADLRRCWMEWTNSWSHLRSLSDEIQTTSDLASTRWTRSRMQSRRRLATSSSWRIRIPIIELKFIFVVSSSHALHTVSHQCVQWAAHLKSVIMVDTATWVKHFCVSSTHTQ